MSHTVRYLVGVSVSTMACASWAQQPSSAALAQPSTTATGEPTNAGLEEIVVTANRRAERSQDVPIAISTLTANTMANAGVTGTATLAIMVPSLVVARQANGATPYLRGIGFSSGDPNSESSVAIYIDGVYQPVAQGNFFEFNNVERIEVLKGPQGTLFGRNATGGVIQIITKDPTFKPVMAFDVGYANYRAPSADFYASTGIGDKIAVNVAAMYKNQENGWGRDLTTGQEIFLGKNYSVRSKILFRPDERTKIILAGDYYYMTDSALSGQPPLGLSGGPPGTNAPEYRAATPAGNTYPGRFNTYANFPNGTTVRNRGVALNIEHDFGGTQFRSITAYRKFSGLWTLDQDQSPLNIVSVTAQERTKTFSQEVHLYAKPDAKLQWLIGSYYFRNNGAFNPLQLSSDFLFPAPFKNVYTYGRTIATSISVFAQATYPIADRLRFTLGGRYTWDRSRYNGEQTAALPGGGSVFFVAPNEGKLSYSRPTGRASLDYKITPSILAYVSYNRGSKSGNFSVAVASAQNALYRPEKLDAYEGGLKSEFLNHRLRLNLAGFYYAYQNLQFQKIIAGASQTVTADDVKIYGVELEANARVTEGLTINANLAYLHSRIGDFPTAPGTSRTATGIDINTPNYNAEGNSTPNSPRFSGNIGFNYLLPTAAGNIDMSSNLYYTTKYASEIDNRPWIQAHPLLSASLKWTDKSGAISVSLWGKNLTNEYYYAQFTGAAGLSDIGSPAAPRTYGITLGYRY